MRVVKSFCSFIILSSQLLSWPFSELLLFGAIQDPLVVRVSGASFELIPDNGRTDYQNLQSSSDILKSSRCENAWRRVLSRIDGNESRELIQFEFCRFLGVLETEANVTLPSFMLGLEPTIMDPKHRRIIVICYPSSERADQTSELTDFALRETRVGVAEKSQNSDGVSYTVSGHDSEIFVQSESMGRMTIDKHSILSNKELAVLLRCGKTYKLAVYGRDQFLPRWSAIARTTTPAKIMTTGLRFHYNAIIEATDSLALLEVGSMEFSLSTFEREKGELLFHFEIHHGEALKETEQLTGEVQERTMSKPDLDE